MDMDGEESRRLFCVADFEMLAREKMQAGSFDHVSGGAADELALQENIAAFRRIKITPHVLRDVSERNLEVEVLGQRLAFPVILAPVACLRRFHPEGELAAARAAALAGVLCTLSTGSGYSLEEVGMTAPGALWFQLYAYTDRELTRNLVKRAEGAGYRALCLTVDVPLSGRRERDLRNQYEFPLELLRTTMTNVGFSQQQIEQHSDDLLPFVAQALTVTLTWPYLDWLRSITDLPIILKGILSSADAKEAVACGVQGIVVSNHGGRQLDCAPGSADVLPEVAQAVQGKIEILLDGGVRRGTDIVKALALGAKAVLIGRPYVWALSADGQRGVERVLAMLRDELDLALALVGCSSCTKVDSSLIWRAPHFT
jgi:4-hydroxymandelate oxidase